MYCSTYLCIYWLLLTCALTMDERENLAYWENGCLNQLSYQDRTVIESFLRHTFIYLISTQTGIYVCFMDL